MGQRYDQLSLDERCEIYRLHADGKSRRAIARALNVAPATINIHRKHVRRKLGIGRKSENFYSHLNDLGGN